MQSENYVPGVSGWKIEKDLIEINGGPFGPVWIGDLDKVAQPKPSAPKPFIIVDGVTYISEAEVERGTINLHRK